MNLRERRAIRRQGWLGYLALLLLVFPGVMLLSGQLSVAFVVLVAVLLCAAFAVGLLLLRANLQARA